MAETFARESPPAVVVVRRASLEELRRRARSARPREACGLLIGRRTDDRAVVRRAVPAVNRAERPDRFTIAAEEVWSAVSEAREAGEELLGIYHSHPDGSAEPSATDRAEAWGGWLHLIVPCGAGDEGLEPACWTWRDGELVAVEVEVT